MSVIRVISPVDNSTNESWRNCCGGVGDENRVAVNDEKIEKFLILQLQFLFLPQQYYNSMNYRFGKFYLIFVAILTFFRVLHVVKLALNFNSVSCYLVCGTTVFLQIYTFTFFRT